MLSDGPFLWYLNRSTGMVLLVLLTLSILLGIWSTRGTAGTRLPRFAVQALHRNLALLASALLGLHVVTAVADEYVDIRWWHAFVPWELHYQPVWLALGVVALDLVLAVVVVSTLRNRLSHRSWWLVHLLTYAAWVMAVAHGLGIGTDTGEGWARATYAGAVGLVLASVVVRLAGARRTSTAPSPGRSNVSLAGVSR